MKKTGINKMAGAKKTKVKKMAGAKKSKVMKKRSGMKNEMKSRGLKNAKQGVKVENFKDMMFKKFGGKT